MFKTQYQFGLLEPVFSHVETENLLRVPAIALYFHACRFLADPAAETHFIRFRATLSGAADQFPPDELRALYLLAINFGVKKSNETGELPWYRETFGLYHEALDRELLLENGVLSRFAYNNIVGVAIRLQEVHWAETFIHRYRPALERKHREASFSLNLARVAYTRGDFGTALLHLQRADYKDFINSMNAKTLQLKIYYETAEFDALDAHLQSMHTFIIRQRAAGYHRENYLHIVRFTRALLRLHAHQPAEMDALRQQMEAEPALSEKEWLLEQLRKILPPGFERQ